MAACSRVQGNRPHACGLPTQEALSTDPHYYSMISIADNIRNVRQRIAEAEKSAGRSANSVQLLAVSKTRTAEEIGRAYQCGLTRFGENYLQEALEKIEALHALPLEWHFIGPLQSNKTRQVAEHFDWIHTVDRLKIAQRLSAQRPEEKAPLNLCIQVNISEEDSKSGVALEEVADLASQIISLPRLRLRGLMCIPAADLTPEALAVCYQRMQAEFQRLKDRHNTLDTLSMGMSDDLAAAIAGGATLVRIGTALFGPRPPKTL